MKRKMNIEDVLKKDHYKSIIRLTSKYQNRNKGLRQLHYRYALIKNHDNIQSTALKTEMEKFFNGDLNKLFKNSTIVKNCITDRNNLTNFLTKLVDMDILDSYHYKNGVTKYYISKFFLGVIAKDSAKKRMDIFHNSSIGDVIPINKIIEFKPSLPIDIMLTVFGMPPELYDMCDEKEKECIVLCFRNIIENAASISKLNHQKNKENTEFDIYISSSML